LTTPFFFDFFKLASCLKIDLDIVMTHQSFRERAAWLRRMPNHWRLLIGSQVVFTAFAIRYRHNLVEKRRKELITENQSGASVA
jgi:hypothetical protein